jgi:hypothetical protein
LNNNKGQFSSARAREAARRRWDVETPLTRALPGFEAFLVGAGELDPRLQAWLDGCGEELSLCYDRLDAFGLGLS